MRNSAIKDIFYNIRGCGKCRDISQNNKERAEAICVAYDKLKTQLSSEQFNLYEKFVDLLEDSYSDDIDFYFSKGFKMGVLIAIECFKDN